MSPIVMLAISVTVLLLLVMAVVLTPLVAAGLIKRTRRARR